MSNSNSKDCQLCYGSYRSFYDLSGYRLGCCSQCGSISVAEMPSMVELQNFYQGFTFQTHSENYTKVATAPVRKWMTDLVERRGQAQMLDVGGGGGFFAKAFEDFGLGESTYIDLDAKACEFAKEKMGLSRVVCDKVENLSDHVGGKKFDFIYCRHVVEHLTDPRALIVQCSDLLSDGGVFVIQCPNGQSKEGLFYPNYWMSFLRKVKRSNDWSASKALLFSISRNYGWGIDPIRHLWAISGQGIRLIFADDKRYSVCVKTASISDRVFSPYWRSRNLYEKLISKLTKPTVNLLFKGMHLVVEVRKK